MLTDPKRFALVPLATAPADAAGDDDDDDGDDVAGKAAAASGGGGAASASPAGKSTRALDTSPAGKSTRNVAAAGGRGGGGADRAFQLEAPSALLKARWVVRLRGRRADGRHRADSAEVQAHFAAIK